ncbi:Pycsar system effector family protein [Streptomyces sp. NPDC050264]|uniref:Pycsar system effector family protein n=1 Tax=Streptomyces sp. NPDC050264 TaxID=3155038 RepID=UPI0034332983
MDDGSGLTPIETAWRMHGVLIDWTGKADSKAVFVLTLQSSVLVVTGTLVGSRHGIGDLNGAGERVILGAGVLLLILGLCLAVAAVSPRLVGRGGGQVRNHDFLYFGHLRSWSSDDLETALREEDPLPVLTRQLIVMSDIAWSKHRRVQWSLLSGLVGLLLIAGAMAIK